MRRARARLRGGGDLAEMNRRADQRGIVLVAVLLAVAIMSVAVVAATSLTRAGISASRVEARLLASSFALRSGLEVAKAAILAAKPEQRLFFDGSPLRLALGDGIVAEVSIRDAAGLVDMNRAPLPLIEALLGEELGAAEAKALAGLVDELRGAAAPPEQQKADAKPAAMPGGTAGKPEVPEAPVVFRAVEQLSLAAEAGPAAQEAVARFFTVFSPRGRVNPFAAPPEVLDAIPGITQADRTAIDGARKIRAWKANGAVMQALERMKDYLAVEEPAVFMIGIRLEGGPGIIAGSTARAVVMLGGTGGLPFRTLAVTGL